MPRLLRPHLFHIYVPERHHFGCPKGMYTQSWVVRLDCIDRIFPEWVCPICLRALGLVADGQARRNMFQIHESNGETPPGAQPMNKPWIDRCWPIL